MKVKGAKKKVSAKHKPVAKRKPTKKKPGPKKKKKSTSGLRMPRMSNFKRFKLFGGTSIRDKLASTINEDKILNALVKNKTTVYDIPELEVIKLLGKLAETELGKTEIYFDNKAYGKNLKKHWNGSGETGAPNVHKRSKWLKNTGEVILYDGKRRRILADLISYLKEDENADNLPPISGTWDPN